MRITAKLLREHRACKEDLECFEELFPDGAEVNEKNATLALESELCLFWLVQKLLPQPAMAEYTSADNAAWREYDMQTESVREDFAFNQEECIRALDSALHQRDRTLGAAFVKIWKKYTK